MKKYTILLAFFSFFLGESAYAYIGPEWKQKIEESNILSTREDCQPGQSQTDLDVNNVRARLLTGGDLWWDLSNGKYVVPKPAPGFPEVSAIFAGGVWIGGVDPAGALKLAGVTYRRGNQTDFYTGPLDEAGQTDAETCSNWDQFFKVKGRNAIAQGRKARLKLTTGKDIECDSIPDDVKYWPGRGNPFWNEKYDFDLPDQELGAFFDLDEDGMYNPCAGDFPIIDVRGCEPEGETRLQRLNEAIRLIPDEMIFWIYNDNGGPHRLSLATSIQMEVQVQAFAYATNDEINDMTFYRYKLINKAKDDILDCYFAMWVDPDLGCYTDDYVGCDVERSMAYVYNEDAVDGQTGCSCPGGVATYCEEVPMLGIDYFRGPRGPKVFRRDADGNLVLDANGKVILDDPEPGTGEQDTIVELGMSSFIYMNNGGVGDPEPSTTDPARDFEFYNYLRGFWKSGQVITKGGSGFNPESSDTAKYVFPGRPNVDAEWSMCSADLPFGDRRTLQATGPLLLQPGATNELIVGAVFVPDVTHPCPDIQKLQFADDLAQALFDNCFRITDGPDSPDMYGVELDRQLVLVLSNDTLESNNAFEKYRDRDLKAPSTIEGDKADYVFEGYKVYQLLNPNVSVSELDDIDKARIIRQVDVKNGITDIYNWYPYTDPTNNEIRFSPKREVEGADAGIRHTFNILEDQFATSDRRLVNYKSYHYLTVAYAYNNYATYNVTDNVGQRKPYLEGRKLKGSDETAIYSFTPRPVVYSELQTAYGDEAVVTRISGEGTGLNALDVEAGMHDKMLAGDFDGRIVYKKGNGPINATVIDPLSIKDGKYQLQIVGDYKFSRRDPKFLEGARWNLTDLNTGEVLASEKSIDEINEQVMYGRGFSLSINQTGRPSEGYNADNGYIGQELEYADNNAVNWWSGINPGSGVNVDIAGNNVSIFTWANTDNKDDIKGVFASKSSAFLPMALAQAGSNAAGAPASVGPGYYKFQSFAELYMRDLNNVDVVFTSDKSKWSRCVVVETANFGYNASTIAQPVGNATQFSPRVAPSVDKNGQPDGDGNGMGWFPGYAVDVETGKRLNIFFGENSVYRDDVDNAVFKEPGKAHNGDDMIFNPTGDLFPGGESIVSNPLSAYGGGQHFVYVTRQDYDECAYLRGELSNAQPLNAEALGLVTWTAWPMTNTPFKSVQEGLIPNDLTVKLRVTNPYNFEIRPRGGTNPARFDTLGNTPTYEFAFEGVEPRAVEEAKYEDALSNVQVVPNPYYAYSSYENTQFATTVKITDLPESAVVTIYSIDGKFIRRINVNEQATVFKGNNPGLSTRRAKSDVEWDLKNSKGVPIASGAYIFHINAPSLKAERTVKWFGINRRFDPSGL